MVNLRRDMIRGLVRVRILRAAGVGAVSGVELSQDLATAGHQVSPGTLYPLLHAMEKAGWVKSTGKMVKGKRRRYYRATKKGRNQLDQALTALDQFLFGIVSVAPDSSNPSGRDGVAAGTGAYTV
jgi:PadR family transcriptional regulator, regulatory protein PadR